MTDPDVRLLIDEHLDDPGTAWSMGTIGAIAEFARTPDEQVKGGPDTVVTARGGIRLTLPRDVLAVAYETPAGPHDRWNHAVALCLPIARAARHRRTTVTELGPDRHSLRPEDRDGVLFDLGLGTPTVDACVRTSDPALLNALRAAEGIPLFSAGSCAATVIAAGPHRVFRTACGRVEVYAAIPPPDGRSPDGPHTHLLPHLLASGRTHAPTVPIPDGYVPVAHCYPAHPATDRTGRPVVFDQLRHAAFQQLLARFGDARQAAVKAETTGAVLAGLPCDRAPGVSGPPEPAAFAVALRQLVHTHPELENLRAWRARHRPSAELLDPDGDPNGG